MEAFLADSSPDAFARVIDRLLSSEHYGQRWGRHWLDVARYADSNGLDENIAHGTAWRYRDYVVDAFNADTDVVVGAFAHVRRREERRRVAAEQARRAAPTTASPAPGATPRQGGSAP